MSRGNDLVENNDEQICVGSGEDGDVHGDGRRVGLVQTHPEVALAAQQEQDEDSCEKGMILAKKNPKILSKVIKYREEVVPSGQRSEANSVGSLTSSIISAQKILSAVPLPFPPLQTRCR